MPSKASRPDVLVETARRVRVGDALAVQAAKECRVIVRALTRTQERQVAIHRARKSIRHARAILALGREDFGDALAPVDRALQRVARSLARLRDAHVVVATARTLADARRGDDAVAWNRVADQLQARSDALLAEALRDDPAFAARRARIHAVARAITALPWHGMKRKTVRRALARSEGRSDSARERASRKASAERLHRWRRRLRKVRLQRDALARIDSALVPSSGHGHESSRKLKRRIDALGRRQDLVVLGQLLGKVSEAGERSRLRAQWKQAMAEVAA